MFHFRKHQHKSIKPAFCMGLICAMLMFSCDVKNKQSSGYYPIDSLLDAQIGTLLKSRAKLTKQSSMSGLNSVNEYTPTDSASWEKELAILGEIDAINRPTSKGLYKVDKALTDPGSNLKVDVFTATENLPVHSLRIYYQNEPAQIRRIEAILEEENALYTSVKNLDLEFQDIDQLLVLTGYTIEGSQKMYLKDSVQYKIAVAITLAN